MPLHRPKVTSLFKCQIPVKIILQYVIFYPISHHITNGERIRLSHSGSRGVDDVIKNKVTWSERDLIRTICDDVLC